MRGRQILDFKHYVVLRVWRSTSVQTSAHHAFHNGADGHIAAVKFLYFGTVPHYDDTVSDLANFFQAV